MPEQPPTSGVPADCEYCGLSRGDGGVVLVRSGRAQAELVSGFGQDGCFLIRAHDSSLVLESNDLVEVQVAVELRG